MIKYTLVILLSVLSCGAEAILTTAPKKGSQGNRFLFIVDTSSSMRPLEQAGRQVVYDLVYSGLEGRMEGGDTFGVWTFGQEVKGGVFPMQSWSSERSPELATAVRNFVKEQSSGRKSQLAVVLTNAETIALTVKDVDMVIVTSAAATLKGNDTWAFLQQSWNARVEEARKNKKAMIIALAARSGRIMQTTVTIQGEPLQLAAPPDRNSPGDISSRRPRGPGPVLKTTREPIIMRGTSSPKTIEEIPTQFSPPPADPDPLINPNPEPVPVPVPRTEKPIVGTKGEAADTLTVAAREPGKGVGVQRPAAGVGRMLIVAGATLMFIAAILGGFILIHIRSRNRMSSISRSMTTKPSDQSTPTPTNSPS
jgi:hypothetical protein